MDARRLRVKNTKERGLLEFLVYPERGKYVGVCLTLDIIEEGRDPAKLLKSIQEAATSHVLFVIKKNLGDELLNRPAPEEYWERYFKAMEQRVDDGRSLKDKPVYFFQMPMPLNRGALAHA
ncbi:MAG: hypothetical protein AAB533_03515 [Patescibacteria group bacterium]